VSFQKVVSDGGDHNTNLTEAPASKGHQVWVLAYHKHGIDSESPDKQRYALAKEKCESLAAANSWLRAQYHAGRIGARAIHAEVEGEIVRIIDVRVFDTDSMEIQVKTAHAKVQDAYESLVKEHVLIPKQGAEKNSTTAFEHTAGAKSDHRSIASWWAEAMRNFSHSKRRLTGNWSESTSNVFKDSRISNHTDMDEDDYEDEDIVNFWVMAYNLYDYDDEPDEDDGTGYHLAQEEVHTRAEAKEWLQNEWDLDHWGARAIHAEVDEENDILAMKLYYFDPEHLEMKPKLMRGKVREGYMELVEAFLQQG